MDPATKLDALRALAILPIFVLVPLALATLIAPVRIAVERRHERDLRERAARRGV